MPAINAADSFILCVNQSSNQFATFAIKISNSLVLFFSTYFTWFQIICVEILLPIVSISDVLRSELCRVLMSGDSGLWAAAMVEFLLKQLEAFFLHSCWMHFHIISRRCN